MKFTLILIIVIAFIEVANGQIYTIRGYVTEAESGERLVQANVFDRVKLRGTTTNSYGFYSFRLPAGQYLLNFSFVGYQTHEINIQLKNDTVLNISLAGNKELGEITVVADDYELQRSKLIISRLDVPVEKIHSLPAFLGEADVFKTLKLMPGVQSGSEGGSGLYIRGGGPDQNLVLLDGIPVYNPEHLFGIFSVFNPDIIKNINLYKGGFPARFGGRLSSVVDISSKDGNLKEYHGGFTIGMISSKLNFEGPIIKGKTSFNISARRSYVDLYTTPLTKTFFDSENFAQYYFYDLNLKLNHIFSDRSRIYFSTYYGYDDISTKIYDSYKISEKKWEERNRFGLDWNNLITSLRWNYLISPRLFGNATLYNTRYDFSASHRYTKESDANKYYKDYSIYYGSLISDTGLKMDFDYYAQPGVLVKFGYNFTKQNFLYDYSDSDKSSVKTAKGSSIDLNFTKPYLQNTYLEADLRLNSVVHLNVGLHASMYSTDEKTFTSFEPRTSLLLSISRKFSMNLSYAEMTQYINLLSSSTFSLPSDLWLPATAGVPPPRSKQFSLGGRYDFGHGYSFNVDGFFKGISGLIEYKEGVSFFENKKDWEDKIEIGRGYSNGAEFFLQKNEGKTTGWIGYTLSWTRRQFDNLNGGRWFYAKYDRRHDVSFILTHKFSKKVDAGITWVYGSGSAATLPTQVFRVDNLPQGAGRTHYLGYFSERNNYRLPNYHRLDLGVNFHKEKKHGTRIWRLGFINAYNRHNPFFLFVGYDKNRYVIKQISLFPILPSISYSYSF